MVGMTRKNSCGTVELFGKNNARKLMRQRDGSEGHLMRGPGQHIGSKPIRPADHQGQGFAAGIAHTAQEFGEALAAQRFSPSMQGDQRLGLARQLEEGGSLLRSEERRVGKEGRSRSTP